MRGPIFCYCKIVGGKIVHCALHDNATYLVGVCEHIHALLRELDIRDAAEKARIDQVVLPFIERTINFAMKEQKDGFGNQLSRLAADKKSAADGRIARRA